MFESNRRSFFSTGAQERQVQQPKQTLPPPSPYSDWESFSRRDQTLRINVEELPPKPPSWPPYGRPMPTEPAMPPTPTPPRPPPPSAPTPTPGSIYGHGPIGIVPPDYSWAPTQHPKSIDWGPMPPRVAPPPSWPPYGRPMPTEPARPPTPTPPSPRYYEHVETPYVQPVERSQRGVAPQASQASTQPSPRPTGVAPRMTIPFLPFSMT